jgi:hypothetical protein
VLAQGSPDALAGSSIPLVKQFMTSEGAG